MKQSRGDTIVEVLLAFSVFSLVAVGTVAVMNRGIASAERSLDVTLVRQQIDAQAELLRYARSIDAPAWESIKTKADTITNAPTTDLTSCPTSPPQNSFIVTTSSSTPTATLNYYDLPATPSMYQPASVHSQFTMGVSPAVVSGIWAVPVKANTNTAASPAAEAYDIYINACWFAPGNERPQVLRTIVRLHDKN